MIIKDVYGGVDPKSIREDHYQRRRMLRMGMDVTSRIVGGAVATAVSGYSVYRTLAPLTKISNVSTDYAKIHIKNIFNNITQIMINLMRYYFLNYLPIQPSCVMAGIPMPSVQELSHAMSDRILKYRATGGIFLAHQEGGEQTLRIVGKAFGRNRYLFLTMLDFLFLYGSAKVVDLFASAPSVVGLGIPLPTFRLNPTKDPWAEVQALNLESGKEEQHLTFPVITRSKVYTNMYIETYEFTESIENGMNCITYSVFLRKYQANYPYKFSWLEDGNGTIIWYYSEDKDDELISNLRRIDLVMEVGFSIAMIMYRFFQYLAGNSIETSVAYVSGININQQNLGSDATTQALQKMYPDLDYNLSELSISQKEELMQVG